MNNEVQKLNPWLSMWMQPRATIQQIIDDDPKKLVLLLAACSGVFETLSRASERSTGDNLDLPIIFAMAIILGPIGGIIGLYISGALIGWTGRWIGGKASFVQVRAAIAWSMVPFLWLSLLWIPELILFGREMFTTEMPRTQASDFLVFTLISFGVVEIAGGIWTVIVYLKSLGQVQGFSAWKALGNVLLAAFVVIVPVAIVAVILFAVSNL